VSARRTDAESVAALVTLMDKASAGERLTLRQMLALLFGWDDERAYRAVEQALRMGWIAHEDGETKPAPLGRDLLSALAGPTAGGK